MAFDPDQLPIPDLGLHCPGCGYPLVGLSQHVCPECGEAFALPDLLPEGDMPPLFADGKPVYATPAIRELLTAYQIHYVRIEDHFRMGFNESHDANTPIGVDRASYFEAIDLIRRQRFGEPMPEPPPPRVEGGDWACAACGEENPSNFEVCWSCEATRPA